MKKFYAIAAVAMMAFAANAQNGAALYATGAGDFEGGEWAPENASEFTYANGVYTLEVTNLTQFKLSTAKGDWTAFNAGAYIVDGGYGKVPGVAKPLMFAGDQADPANIMCPWTGDYKIEVAGNLSTITLTTSTPEPDMDNLNIFLRGDMNGWGSPDEWKLKKYPTSSEYSYYTFTCADDQYIGVGDTFKVADANWGEINYGTSGGNLALEADYQVWYNADNIALDEEWSGIMFIDLTMAPDDVWVFFSNDKDALPSWDGIDSAAVENVVVESNAVATYYNLQGVKVNNPENGVFIVVKDGKATKFVK